MHVRFVTHPSYPQPETHWWWNQAENSQTVAPNSLLRGEGLLKIQLLGLPQAFPFLNSRAICFKQQVDLRKTSQP